MRVANVTDVKFNRESMPAEAGARQILKGIRTRLFRA